MDDKFKLLLILYAICITIYLVFMKCAGDAVHNNNGNVEVVDSITTDSSGCDINEESDTLWQRLLDDSIL